MTGAPAAHTPEADEADGHWCPACFGPSSLCVWRRTLVLNAVLVDQLAAR